jgi:predicted DNA-binding protein (MmcQ/YjbR family)
MTRSKDAGGSAADRLREFGLRYPGAHIKSPWPGHLDLAVNDKTFAYLSPAGEPLTISCKLPRSADAALSLPFTTPTAYGLGKSGWVTASFPDDAALPIELLQEWIDESYRAQAPKRLSAGLPALDSAGTQLESSPGRAERRAPTPRRSTVKQSAPASDARVPAPTRPQKRRPVRARSQRTELRAKKRPSISQGAAKRAPERR